MIKNDIRTEALEVVVVVVVVLVVKTSSIMCKGFTFAWQSCIWRHKHHHHHHHEKNCRTSSVCCSSGREAVSQSVFFRLCEARHGTFWNTKKSELPVLTSLDPDSFVGWVETASVLLITRCSFSICLFLSQTRSVHYSLDNSKNVLLFLLSFCAAVCKIKETDYRNLLKLTSATDTRF